MPAMAKSSLPPRRLFPIVVWSLAILLLAVLGLLVASVLYLDFSLESGIASLDHKARVQDLRRDRDLVERQLSPPEPFHAEMIRLAAERLDYPAFRQIRMWRIMRISFIIRLSLYATALLAFAAALAGRKWARWCIFGMAMVLVICSGLEAWALNRDLSRFSASFGRDLGIAHEEVQDEIEYRASLPGFGTLDRQQSRALGLGWFFLSSLPWQFIGLLSAIGLFKKVKPQAEDEDPRPLPDEEEQS
ncbi:MAG: hypothetical protein V3W41_03490 [Planctomycetota bacterium]